MNDKWRIAGFTLVELMVVVAILAILAAVASTSYAKYAFRARRVDGQEFLMRVANAQERHYATVGRYAGDPITDTLRFSSTDSDKGSYRITITSTDLVGHYKATARPLGIQVADVCGDLSIDSVGIRRPPTSDTVRNANGNCW